MWVIGYLAAIVALLLIAQTVVLKLFKEPLQWTFGANSQQSKSLKLALKVVLQTTLIGSIFVFPFLVGKTPGQYYASFFPWEKAHYFWYGQLCALGLSAGIYGSELLGGWLYYKPRFTPKKAFAKSALSTLSSFTVVAVEEPVFRGIVMWTLWQDVGPWVAIPLSAVLFSAAHFIRKVRTYWPSVGLAFLGLWLGVCFYKTGNLWLSMGLHSGGILSIGVHRCFLNYRGPEWLIGTQTFPIAGAIAIGVMVVGTIVTWFIF